MEILKQLTPAESRFLISLNEASPKDLLKLTLSDLILKEVLVIKKQETAEKAPVILSGKNFDSYQAQPHEEVFLTPLRKAPELMILLKHFVEMAYQKLGYPEAYHADYLKKTKRLKDCFKDGFWRNLLGFITLNEEGRKLQEKVKRYYDKLQRKVDNHEPITAEEFQSIGTNIIVLKNLGPDKVRELEKAWHMPQKKEDYNYHDSYMGQDYFFFEFMIFYELLDLLDDSTTQHYGFDDTFDSVDDSFADSDIGADSGCSSCASCASD
jgi:hypothetical protein